MTELKQIEKLIWEVPKENEMKVPGRIYGDKNLIDILLNEEKTDWSSLSQLKNVAKLPGIQKYALALADVHPGYGAPIGGVSAFDIETGVIVFGNIGFDINCGVRTLKTPLKKDDVENAKEKFAKELFEKIPAGLGVTGELKLNQNEIDDVIVKGAEFAIERGYGFKEDLKYTEENGKIAGANPETVSIKAKQRQFKEVGTLGSGNHYLEVQYVEEIFDEKAAKTFGLFKEQIVVSIHCGSRALGHQIGSDYLQFLDTAAKKYGIRIADKELVCAPIKSAEGEKYFSAVKGGINVAFANRQAIGHLTRGVFQKVFGISEREIKMLYDVGHNTAKVETHNVDGKMKKLLVHRKGSTRGFGPDREEIPEEYRSIGQPVLVGGTMGTCSYILHGTEKGMLETFGSTVHGAGRVMSRMKAKREIRSDTLLQDLKRQGIIVKGHSMAGLAEEAPAAYKDVTEVVNVMHNSQVTMKVAKLKPMICIKG